MIGYRLICFFLKYPIRALLNFVIVGESNLPAEGGIIVVSNHTHWFDPVTIAFSAKRTFRFMAKAELFDTPVKSLLMRALGAFPIRRGKGDRRALNNAVEILKSGEPVIMFPEGTRSRTGELKPFKAGVALLAHRSGCPVIPIAIEYMGGRPVVFRKTKVIIGEPIMPSEFGEDNAEGFRAGAAMLHDRIKAMQESEKASE